jgi:hypothetical protein
MDEGADTCEEMESGEIDLILDLFDVPEFRGGVPECNEMRQIITDLLEESGAGFRGASAAGRAGLAGFSSSAPLWVWFEDGMFGTSRSLEERQVVLGHEAHHLHFLSSDEALATPGGRVLL